ncbi:MAG: hypothetical protein KME52_21815 [Desmonostoc geniculatum HA4340-LM1]|nr:hypothetical protein [Desmonostoc geniculatum HA4340-LM1]
MHLGYLYYSSKVIRLLSIFLDGELGIGYWQLRSQNPNLLHWDALRMHFCGDRTLDRDGKNISSITAIFR